MLLPDFPVLQPGDVLLFSRGGLFNWIIKTKTWSHVSHCEGVALTNCGLRAIASRNGKGCAVYPLDYKGLAFVLRPTVPFDNKSALDWFYRERIWQQGYDWIGLVSFTSAKWQGRENGKMFCSEFLTRWLRKGGIDPFNGYDADGIAPGEFCKSPMFRTIWRADGKPVAAPAGV